VKESGWGAYFSLINLALVAFADSKNAILKDGGLEIANVKDILSSGIARPMTTTCARMQSFKTLSTSSRVKHR